MRWIGAHEAQAQWSRLLDEVAAGESMTITRYGRPVARLVPAKPARSAATAAAALLVAFRREHRLGGVRIRELIDQGR